MSAHESGKLFAVVDRKRVLSDEKLSVRGRSFSMRWIYDTHVTLACGCVIVHPRRDPKTPKRSRCRAIGAHASAAA